MLSVITLLYFSVSSSTALRIPRTASTTFNARDDPLERVWGSNAHCRIGSEAKTIAVVGGSSTAGGGGVGVNQTWFAHLRQRFKDAEMFNAAHGTSDSYWCSMVLDSLIDDADIFFWEYAINDAKAKIPHATPAEMKEEIALLTLRASRLPSKPALAFVYLWDTDTFRNNFKSSALSAQRPVLERMAEAGLDITVIPAAPVCRSMGQSALADEHHPSISGHKKIAQLVDKELPLTSTSGCNFMKQGDDDSVRSVLNQFTDNDLLLKMAALRGSSAVFSQPQYGTDRFTSKASVCSLNEGN